MERQFRVTWPQQIEADLIMTAMAGLDNGFRQSVMRVRIAMMTVAPKGRGHVGDRNLGTPTAK